jgi:hypothetical protein
LGPLNIACTLQDGNAIDEIIEYMPRDSLIQLAMVCQRFRRPCQQALFKNVHLVIFRHNIVRRFVNALNDHADLKGYVESINLELRVSSKKTIHLFRMISEVLPHLCRLTSMTIVLWSWSAHDILVYFSEMLAHIFPIAFECLTFSFVWVSQAIGTEWPCPSDSFPIACGGWDSTRQQRTQAFTDAAGK